ncbi:50S ribosomal protein L12 [Candidatus Tiddalikarchaeum anstoanum]|nr:50S ribosomal protein L12 [Candidatus Tiddalikarchaeum anstoanum]
MEYIYAALLLNQAGKKVDAEGMKKVLESAGVKVDEARVKALVSALEGVNIKDVIAKAAIATVAAPIAGNQPAAKEKKEEKEEEKVSEAEAAAGLGALFG